MATLALAFTLEALLVLDRPRLVAAIGSSAFVLTVVWWASAGWGKRSSGLSLTAVLTSQPTFPVMVLFGWGLLVLYLAQVRAHEQLAAAHLQLRAAAERIETLAVLTERQRMAGELHDTLAQGLVSVLMQLQAANARLSQQRYPHAQEAVHQAMADIRMTLTQARSAIADLRAVPATASDLREAIDAAGARFTMATSLPCNIHLEDMERIPPLGYDHLLRLITEGLSNIARHAHARRVDISGEARETAYVVQVCDDGCGFNVSAALTASGHFGLVGLYERARLLGGSLEMTRAPQRGTVLRLSLPLSGEAGDQESKERSTAR